MSKLYLYSVFPAFLGVSFFVSADTLPETREKATRAEGNIIDRRLNHSIFEKAIRARGNRLQISFLRPETHKAPRDWGNKTIKIAQSSELTKGKSSGPAKDAGPADSPASLDGSVYSEWIKGLELNFPKEIRLKGNKPDLSSVIQQLKRVEESHYDNFWSLDDIVSDLLSDPVKKLCAKSAAPEECRNNASEDLQNAAEEIGQKMAGRILYPTDYRPKAKGVSDERLQKAFQALDSECPSACGGYDVSRAFFEGSPDQYQRLYEKLKGKDQKCQKEFMAEAADKAQYEALPKQCVKEENKGHPVCGNMLKDLDAVSKRVSEMADLIYEPEDTEAGALCLDCVWGDGSSVAPLKKFSQSLKEQSQCLELNPGEEKHISSGNGMNENYLLKRDPDGGYSIVFPMRFAVDEDYDGPFPKKEAPGRYRTQVQECLAEANRSMLGPNGEQLKILIENPSEQNKDPSEKSQCRSNPWGVKNIYIGSKDHRSNSYKYESDIDCPTIVHEVLHLTGLCDEYKETQRGFYTDPETGESVGANFGRNKNKEIDSSLYDFTPAYDCRLTTQNSIMSNHYERWLNVKNGKNKSLLTPGQFQSILYGGCPGKNKKFNKCSKLAYQSSQSAAKEDCREIKLQCERENSLGRDKQETIEALQKKIKRLEEAKEDMLSYQKKLQDSEIWTVSFRDWNEKSLKEITERIQSERELLILAQSKEEQEERKSTIDDLLDQQKWISMYYKIKEEAGRLDETFKEEYEGLLKSSEKELQAAREELEITQSWPDS